MSRKQAPPSSTKIQSKDYTNMSHFRASPKANPSQRPSRAKSVTPEVNGGSESMSGIMRVEMFNKPKSGEFVMGSQKSKELEEIRVVGSVKKTQVVVEQFAKPRRQRHSVDHNCKRNEEDPHQRIKKLEGRIEMSESLINNLQAEVLGLKAELGKELGLKLELQAQNEKLSEKLAAAEAKIAAFTTPQQRVTNGEYRSPKFKDLQKLIANKLESSVVKKEATLNEMSPIKVASSTSPPTSVIPRVAATFSPPPPPPPPSLRPPPPPPPLPLMKVVTTQKAPERKRVSPESRNHHKPVTTSAQNSIVGEFQNRSAHLIAIKEDVETKGEFINGLIQKVLAAAYTDIEDVLKFVDWLDGELSSLADERAVLKHFKWPERKADAMREATIEYRDLKLLESEISSYKDDTTIQCAAALKKMAGLLDRSERSIQRLVKLRNSVKQSYQHCKIPTDWMLDSGIVRTIKHASMNLAKIYMKRVTLESIRCSDRESSQGSLLVQGVNFAYRAHQFAGGFDSETLCAFEEIRQRARRHLGGSKELMAGIASS